jgi:hypothetical protein
MPFFILIHSLKAARVPRRIAFSVLPAGFLAFPTADSLPDPVSRISGAVCRQLKTWPGLQRRVRDGFSPSSLLKPCGLPGCKKEYMNYLLVSRQEL